MVRCFVAAAMAGPIVLVLAGTAGSQGVQESVTGVWELISSKNLATGATMQPTNFGIGMRAIYLEGHFMEFTAARDRAKPQQSPAEMTREQLLDRFRVAGMSGTYSVKGNVLSRRIIAAANPLAEGSELVGEYSLEDDTLLIIRPNGVQQRVEERWRRLAPAER